MPAHDRKFVEPNQRQEKNILGTLFNEKRRIFDLQTIVVRVADFRLFALSFFCAWMRGACEVCNLKSRPSSMQYFICFRHIVSSHRQPSSGRERVCACGCVGGTRRPDCWFVSIGSKHKTPNTYKTWMINMLSAIKMDACGVVGHFTISHRQKSHTRKRQTHSNTRTGTVQFGHTLSECKMFQLNL